MRASKSRVGISFKSRIRGCVPVLFYAQFISHDSHLASVSVKRYASSKTTQNNPKPRKHQNKQMQVDQAEIVPNAQATSLSHILIDLLRYRVKFRLGSHEVQHTSARTAAMLQSSSVAFEFARSESERNILHPNHRACLSIK
jgi:hypothetical protein